jgi:hypothetical protein
LFFLSVLEPYSSHCTDKEAEPITLATQWFGPLREQRRGSEGMANTPPAIRRTAKQIMPHHCLLHTLFLIKQEVSKKINK